VLCAKGSAGIMQHYSPARLKKPLLSAGRAAPANSRKSPGTRRWSLRPAGSAEVREHRSEESSPSSPAATRASPDRLVGAAFGTPNYAAHGGFCSVNMAAAGIYTMGGAFWEFGAPDWERTSLFMIFGVAEDHDSNPIKMGWASSRQRGAKVIGVNPVRTGYNAIADEWVGITPGTDGLLILALAHELLRTGKIDLDYLIRYTNAPWLVIRRSRRGRSRAFRARRRGRAAGLGPEEQASAAPQAKRRA
jgi:anaerobic selenocysteine-containing dehydrogenase